MGHFTSSFLIFGGHESSLSRYEGKVADHNFGALIRMNSEEEYSESNTIFGAFSLLASSLVTKPAGSDANAIFRFRGNAKL